MRDQLNVMNTFYTYMHVGARVYVYIYLLVAWPDMHIDELEPLLTRSIYDTCTDKSYLRRILIIRSHVYVSCRIILSLILDLCCDQLGINVPLYDQLRLNDPCKLVI